MYISVASLIDFKQDLKGTQLLEKVKHIVTDKLKELDTSLQSLRLHPEITLLALELVYNFIQRI